MWVCKRERERERGGVFKTPSSHKSTGECIFMRDRLGGEVWLTSCGMVFRKLAGISLCLRFSRTWGVDG